LPYRSFSSALVRVGAVSNVAVEIFRHGDFRGERAPILRDLNVFLLEDDFPAVVGDFRSAPFPFDLIKRRDGSIAEPFFFLSILFFRRAAECVGLFSDADGIPGLS